MPVVRAHRHRGAVQPVRCRRHSRGGGRCPAHRRGEISPALLDRRSGCLSRRRAALGAVTGLAAAVDGPALPDLVVAVGELGLDFYRHLSPPEHQLEVLEAQLAIALETGKPVCVHSRSAEDAIIEPLTTYARAWDRAWPDRRTWDRSC